jgi:hypothetical protein
MPTLDQSYTDQNTQLAIGYAANTEWRAQQITIGQSGQITQVDLYLKRSGNGGNDRTVTIYSDSSNDPDVAVSDPTTIDVSAIGTSLEWVTLTITNGPTVSAGEKYHIVVGHDSNSTSNYIEWGCDSTSPTYAGGVSNYSAAATGPWTATANIDMDFKQYYDSLGAGAGVSIPLLGVG